MQVVFLDATKAFDRVEYVRLFKLLLNRGLCPVTARLLLTMYTNQYVVVNWGNAAAKPFKCANGVKQGGVLSPILFGVYIDELLMRLKNAGFGCHIGHNFIGALAYADDIVLMAPTVSCISKMLKLCSEFSLDYKVIFNPDKSRHMICGKCDSYPNLFIDNLPIKKVNTFEHLGHVVEKNASHDSVSSCIKRFHAETNILMAQFGNIFSDTRYKLFKTYCMPLYGCQLWDFSKPEVERFYTAWRKAIRVIWRLPYRSHCQLLPLICDDIPVELQLHKRFLKFFQKVITSNNELVKFCGSLAIGGSCSTTCNSLNYIATKYGMNKYAMVYGNLQWISQDISQFIANHEVNDNNSRIGAFVRELCLARDTKFQSIVSR